MLFNDLLAFFKQALERLIHLQFFLKQKRANKYFKSGLNENFNIENTK